MSNGNGNGNGNGHGDGHRDDYKELLSDPELAEQFNHLVALAEARGSIKTKSAMACWPPPPSICWLEASQHVA